MKNVLMLVCALCLVSAVACKSKEVKEEVAAPAATTVTVDASDNVVFDNSAATQAHEKYMQGLALFNQNKYKEAIKVWEEGLKLDPTNEDLKRAIDRTKAILAEKEANRK